MGKIAKKDPPHGHSSVFASPVGDGERSKTGVRVGAVFAERERLPKTAY
jgi:hypothetical protein